MAPETAVYEFAAKSMIFTMCGVSLFALWAQQVQLVHNYILRTYVNCEMPPNVNTIDPFKLIQQLFQALLPYYTLLVLHVHNIETAISYNLTDTDIR